MISRRTGHGRRPAAAVPRAQRKRSPWDWFVRATLLGAVLVVAAVFLLAVAVTLLGYLLPVPTATAHLAVRTAAVIVGLACAGALVVAGRVVRRDSLVPYETAGLSTTEDIPVVGVLAEPVRRLLSPFGPEGGLTGRHSR